MAKKIDPVTQSQSYLSNLLGKTNVHPIPQGNETAFPQAVAPANIAEHPVPAEPMVEARTAGRKKKNQEIKIRTSFTVLPSDFDDLRRIVYMERKSVSSILGDFIKQYNEAHKKALEDYYKMPPEERDSFESGWK